MLRFIMVMRGGKEVITVEIFREAYEIMKCVALKKRWNTKDHINSVLKEAIDRERFLQAYAPYLLKAGCEESVLFIKDSKLGKTAEVYLRVQMLHCNICESRGCSHIHYVLGLPKATKLFLRRASKSTGY